MFNLQPRTVAIHWIATTFGTWLHGDPRGSWHEGKLIGPDPFLRETILRRMTHDAIVLTTAEQYWVERVIRDTCEEQNHEIVSLTVQATHLHLILGAKLREDIKTTIARLKRRTAVKIFSQRRSQGLTVPKSLWTEGRYVIFLDEDEHVENTIEYVERHNQPI